MILTVKAIISYSVNQLIFVMVKCSVFFAVRTEFLNVIYMNIGLQRVINRLLIHTVTIYNG
jgi:hypothetical protein